MASAS